MNELKITPRVDGLILLMPGAIFYSCLKKPVKTRRVLRAAHLERWGHEVERRHHDSMNKYYWWLYGGAK